MANINWPKLVEHAAIIAVAALLSDLLAHVPVADAGLAGLLVVGLRYGLDAVKNLGG